ncbi:hypothetical protein FLL45_18930 [Aliikangiella marina]|uniref:DUF3313 domain-containing protein n=1 Tax=Aliikangiella marina TaxID=1712262 RepID=A0A545T519_9GAMM|nr:hypothetical protein [Aliikangiella marina]TQV72293.1 hypothetical protein FLL45_18930 [Aliikangiella marina]
MQNVNLMKFFLILLMLVISGCASYTTPGGPAKLSELSESSINELMANRPAAAFPANIALVRVQSSSYSAYRAQVYGQGRYSVVYVRDSETEAYLNQLSEMKGVHGVAAINRMLVPQNLDSLLSLRQAAARLKADILLVYTFDTQFHVGEQKLAPLNTILLGMLANKKVSVNTTVSAAFYDVRTEYLYGITEASVDDSKYSSIWGESAAVDDLRLNNEKRALKKLVDGIETSWEDILKAYQPVEFDTTASVD